MIFAIILIVLVVFTLAFFNRPVFGKRLKGEKIERIKNSPNYRDGSFQNQHETQQLTSGKSYPATIYDFLFGEKLPTRPEKELPVIKKNLWHIDLEGDYLVWFGHSSCFLQVDGIRVLVDPVFVEASPVSFYNKPFKGPDVFKPEDIPDTDCIVITHDHWDHLDYKTIIALKDRINIYVCGLGVGEHLRHWGIEEHRIIELDWNETSSNYYGLTVHCCPTRHFSGRSLPVNQTLWASYLLEFPSRKIYISGDGGYDDRFAKIGEKFKEIDLAIMENGQYGEGWKYIHLFPDQVIQAFKDLNAKTLFTVHHSKYALAQHPWDEPLNKVSSLAEQDSIHMIQPMIGEIVDLNDEGYTLNKWW